MLVHHNVQNGEIVVEKNIQIILADHCLLLFRIFCIEQYSV